MIGSTEENDQHKFETDVNHNGTQYLAYLPFKTDYTIL